MSAPEIASDGTVVLHALASPTRGFAAVVGRRRAAVALVLATAASLAAAAVVIPRIDYTDVARVEVRPGEEPTPAQREEAARTARAIGEVKGYAGAVALPSLGALAAALLLFLGFRVAGTRPGFKETFAVTAHGMLPVWIGRLLAIPAAVARAPLRPDEAAALLPSSLAGLLPAGAPPPLAAAVSALDLFVLWALVLVTLGMARASGASRARAAAVTAILFLAAVAILKVVPAAGGPGLR
jgi:hypothetical protein